MDIDITLEEWNLLRRVAQEHKDVDVRIHAMRIVFKLASKLPAEDRKRIKWE